MPKEDGIHFLVRTWKDRYSHSSYYYFLTPSVFRFVMVPGDDCKKPQTDLGITKMYPESEFETKMQNLQKRNEVSIYMKQIS